MARMSMARNVLKSYQELGLAVSMAAFVAACSTGSGAAGSGTSAAAAGTPCNPVSQNQGCFNNVRMQCTADATSTLGGKWSSAGACATNEICLEAADPSSTSKHIAQCKSSTGTGADATTGSDATTGADGTISGGDDTGTTTKDTGTTIGQCGDGFCNTGETAATCPADCGGTTTSCGNGICEAGETKISCAADCATTTNNCGNGTCDAGETASTCPADCGSTTNNCGNGTCDAGETNATCPQDCPSGTTQQQCIQTNCPNELNACGNDAKCVALNTCLGTCSGNTDTACINKCATTAGQAATTEFNALGKCAQTAGCFGSTSGTCGDGTCDANETKASCPADCGSTTTSNICDANCAATSAVGQGCYCDNQCAQYGDCCDAAGSAPDPNAPNTTCAGSTCTACNGGTTTGPVCGNGKCETGETTAKCPQDCPATTPSCGDGTCNGTETTATCPGDCPAKTCTTYTDVQAIFQNNCNGCHGHKFGNGCSSASSYASINAYVQSGSMPQGSSLSSADKAKIAAWAAAKNACTTATCP